MRLIINIFIIVTIIGCRHNMTSFNNKDVYWTADYIGIHASIYPSSFSGQQENIITDQQLLQMLNKKESWILTHVILTKRYNLSNLRTPTSWNQLKIDIAANGDIIYDENQRNEIAAFWNDKLKKDGLGSE